MSNIRDGIEFAARCIEMLAVAVMLGLIVLGTITWMLRAVRRVEHAYERFRVGLGKALLLGLELLVAADIIRTVALDTSLANIAMLAALVLVRTFLGWTLAVEVEGHWPWQKVKRVREVEK